MRVLRTLLAAIVTSLTWTGQADAVPAFAEQTGQPCSACHIGGYGPQLTLFGRQFKADSYSMRAGEEFTLPVSAAAIASYVHTNSDQSSAPAPHYANNDNVTLDAASIYVAGGFDDHFGGLSQWSYDGVARALHWDMLDVRASTHVTISGSDVILGLALDNAPTLDDLWNTLPGFGFPYTDSALAPNPMASTVLNGGLMQTVLGTNAYMYWDSSVMATIGLYWTPSRGFLRAMGTSVAGMSGSIDGAAPYFRVSYQKDLGDQNFEAGGFAFLTELFPGGDTSMGTDRHDDVGLDASYQYLLDPENAYTLNMRYMHEWENLKATFAMSGASAPNDSLNEYTMDASYSWHNTIMGTVQYFETWGSKDSLLYMANRTFSPESSGFMLEASYMPFSDETAPVNGRLSLMVGLQYRIFTKFDGAATNFDGLGRNASDNNTLRLYIWMML